MPKHLAVHVLQPYPLSCPNRDDNNMPKTYQYGGALRAYMSSQSQKSAMRKYFKNMLYDQLDTDELGYRTVRVPALVVDAILDLDPTKDPESAAALMKAGLPLVLPLQDKKEKDEEEEEETAPSEEAEDRLKAMYLVSTKQAKAIADILLRHEEELFAKPEEDKKGKGKKSKKASPADAAKKQVKEEIMQVFETAPSIDAILFGSMSAGEKRLSVDAVCQVSAATTVNAVDLHTDYYIGKDDLKPESSGAAMLGDTYGTSGLYYKWASLNLSELQAKRDDAAHIASLFVKAFLESQPAGKLNSYGNNTPVYMAVVEASDRNLFNLIDAFDEPIVSKTGYKEKAGTRLIQHMRDVDEDYGAPQIRLVSGRPMEPDGKKVPLKDMAKVLEEELTAFLQKPEGR